MPVTVNEALKKGRATLTYTSVAILFVFLGAGFYLSTVYPYLTGVMIVGGMVLGCLFCLLYWGVQVTKWKIWAYENVDNIHEFQQRAIDSKLLYPDNSAWNRIVIQSADDKQRLAALQDRFKQKDVYNDDVTVPAEMMIYFSKPVSMVTMLIGAAMVGFAIYLGASQSLVFGAILGLGGAFFLYSGLKEYTNTKPQIILNSSGIQTANTTLQNWNTITGDRVYVETSGRNSITYFTYDYPGGTEKVNIGDLTIDPAAAAKLVACIQIEERKTEGA